MEHEIEISYPVPRRRLLDLRRLRRAALRFLCASGALCLFINLCTGGPAWSLVVLVSLWFVWTNLLAPGRSWRTGSQSGYPACCSVSASWC